MTESTKRKPVIEDGIELNQCEKCGCTTVIYKKEHWVCEKCGELII